MSWLLDTNVVSELRKGSRADVNVLDWARRIEGERQRISVLSLGEIRKGIERVRATDPVQAESLERWLLNLCSRYEDDLLPVCGAVADHWGRLNAQRTLPVIDGLLAATAAVHQLRLATRNVADFEGTGIEVVNPFEA